MPFTGRRTQIRRVGHNSASIPSIFHPIPRLHRGIYSATDCSSAIPLVAFSKVKRFPARPERKSLIRRKNHLSWQYYFLHRRARKDADSGRELRMGFNMNPKCARRWHSFQLHIILSIISLPLSSPSPRPYTVDNHPSILPGMSWHPKGVTEEKVSSHTDYTRMKNIMN